MGRMKQPLSLAAILWMVSLCLFPGAAAQNKQEQIQKEEAQDYYRKWLNEDVRYIITEEEKEIFLSLTTPEEKERFIEQFWLRRDTDASTTANEFKEEHYRRIAYANEHFDEGTPGWLTDRGRVYIIHGQPDQIESHEAGEVAYERLPQEGRGQTATFPFLRWWYRHIEGVGDNVELEFVDKRFTGAYKLTTDPFEKDALMQTNFGQTLAEMTGISDRVERYRYNPHRGPDLLNYRAQDNPFEKYRRFVQVQAPRPIKYRDLERIVDVNITYELLPVKVRLDYLRLEDTYALVPVTLQFENRDLNFKQEGSVYVARMAVYGKVTSLGNRLVTEFDDDMITSYRPEFLERRLTEVSLYQKMLTLEAKTRYKLDLVVKDLNSGKVGLIQQAIIPPSYDRQTLAVSSLILTNSIKTLDRIPDEDEMFVIGDVKMHPSLGNAFPKDRPLAVYLQLYQATLDQSSDLPSLRLTYRILKDGEAVKEFVDESGESIQYSSSQRVVLIKVLPLSDLEPGRYSLTVEARDRISNQAVTARQDFQVVESPRLASKAYE